MSRTTWDVINEVASKCNREWQNDTNFLHNVLPEPSFDGAVVGSFTVYNVRTRTVHISRSSDWVDAPVSPSSVARKVMEDAIKDTGKKRIFNHPSSRHLAQMCHPLYAQHIETDLIYLDLSAAHYNIYKRLPVHFWFDGEHMTYSHMMLADYLPSDWQGFKLARNCLTGLFHAETVTKIKDKRLVTTPVKANTYSPSHWGFIQCTLHWLAQKAVEHGAMYVYTDGYIFPQDENVQGFTEFLDAWGFPWDIKGLGSGYVGGVGRYRVGEKGSKFTTFSEPFDNLKKVVTMEAHLIKLQALLENRRVF